MIMALNDQASHAASAVEGVISYLDASVRQILSSCADRKFKIAESSKAAWLSWASSPFRGTACLQSHGVASVSSISSAHYIATHKPVEKQI